VPGLGPARIGALIDAFGTEMTVIHETIESDIAEVVGEEIAHRICLAREGRLGIQSGGGGAYGKAVVE
jgi:PHP family Zn ribbon phosphoesterase